MEQYNKLFIYTKYNSIIKWTVWNNGNNWILSCTCIYLWINLTTTL